MKSNEIRNSFRDFFLENGHESRPSSSLVPAGDPSVLLTTAGMQQFKPFFLGIQEPPFPRLTTCQKCFRTTDIDQVGKTARHLTFFEMLGNFSFGDYFKEGAIDLAWRYSTEYLNLDISRLWVSVFEGDGSVQPDEEAAKAWLKAGLPAKRIVRLPASENFWSAGPTGPCGPCTELYFDLGEEAGCGKDDCAPGCDCDRFVEYWNLVFMEFNRDEAGVLSPLPRKNVDTGMGLERITSVLEGKLSVFETDLFEPVISFVCDTAQVSYGKDKATDRAIRVLADHSRAITFLAADGVFAGNESKGYVLRRVMRRAIRAASILGIEEPFLSRVCERVIETMKDTYPELAEHRVIISEVAAQEEHRFGMTLEQGNAILTEAIENARESGAGKVDGETAFRLHDTYGFPFDLTHEILQEEGLDVDEEEFDRLMEEQRRRARASMKAISNKEREAMAELGRKAKVKTEFVGYEKNELYTSIGDLMEIEGGRMIMKLRESPFYAEAGGQVADTGWIHTDNGRADVVEVFSLDGDQVILAELEEGRLEAGARAKAMINRVRRHAIACNHTATHLLHNSLRNLLGEQVRQAGSAVGPEKMRFDFSHGAALSHEDIINIEDTVNRKIIENHPVKAFTTTMEYARDMGAVALFDEKYGDYVRVIEIGDFSRELCGGTHVTSTAQIGAFKILSEASAGANLRRIEAVTSHVALDLLRGNDRLLEAVAKSLGADAGNLEAAVEKMKEEMRGFKQLADKQAAGESRQLSRELVEKAESCAGINVVAEEVTVANPDDLLALSDMVLKEASPGAVLLAAVIEGKVSMVANFSDQAVEKGARAGELIADIAPVVGGKGGGRPNMARGGGSESGRVGEAVEKARSWFAARLG